jgi:AraC family transcriptional regulator of adaptative response / DNA-3-methyladenine glycosylase II
MPHPSANCAEGCHEHHVRFRRVFPPSTRYDVPMLIDNDTCYAAMRTHDSRFDGQFFVGVSSTRVYCRPVCSVKLPKRENCKFYPSAAAAEVAGFRPCLRCRPELAPGMASVDASGRLARSAAGLIEEGFLTDTHLDELSERLGVTDRHLRRVFMSEFGVSPVDYAQTQRLLLAKRLLTDTPMPITDVAMAAGFGSVRRFNALFLERYRLKPGDLRKSKSASARQELAFELGYRPPYAWDAQLDFLAGRAIAGVESVDNGVYRRTVSLAKGTAVYAGWFAVEPVKSRPLVRVILSASLAAVVPQLLGRVRRVFDLDCRPDEIAQQLGTLAAKEPGLRLPGAFDGFEIAVRAILGQQITVKAARTLAGRFAHIFGDEIETPFEGLVRVFPSSGRISQETAKSLQRVSVTSARAKTILTLAKACAAGDVSFGPAVNVEQTMDALRNVAGIGEWTAQYIAMRGLGWPDAFPHTDYGVKKALGDISGKEILQRAEQWRPWRAYATIHLWRSLR